LRRGFRCVYRLGNFCVHHERNSTEVRS
jgi:hypothetical protein